MSKLVTINHLANNISGVGEIITTTPTTLTPHGFCLFWDPTLLAVFIFSNGLIALAYFVIPWQILIMLRRGRGKIGMWQSLLFCGFISSCGVTHIIDILTIWYPWYWLQASVDTWTALISYFTAMVLGMSLLQRESQSDERFQSK